MLANFETTSADQEPLENRVSSLRSEEVEELLGQPPHNLVIWGMSGFLVIVAMIILTSWLVKYPDIIKVPFVLNSVSSPKALSTRIEGRLTRLLVEDHRHVRTNEVLAYLESTARHEQVIALSSQLDSLQRQVLQSGLVDNSQYLRIVHTFYQLGELQGAFQAFIIDLQHYVATQQDGFYIHKMKLLNNELAHLREVSKSLKRQQALYGEDFALMEEEFDMQQGLLQEKVIAPLELKREHSKLLAKQIPLRQVEMQLVNNTAAQMAKQKDILELEKIIAEQRITFIQVLSTFRSQIADWKKKYIVESPMNGRIHFSSFLQENQLVKAGQEVFFIGTEETKEFGQVRIPQYNFGKVKSGQKVLIRFDSYPSEEFGVVEGRVVFISEIPANDNTFLAKVVLPHGLSTNYRKKLTYRIGMTATAEIVTEDARLLERLFYNLRKTLNK